MNRIAGRLFLITVAAGLVPVLVMMIASSSIFGQRLVESELTSMSMLTNEVARQVDGIFSRAARELTYLPENERLVSSNSDPETSQRELQRLRKVHDLFTEISLYDEHGFAIASTSPDDVSQEFTAWFEKAKSGTVCISRPVASGMRERVHFSLYLPVPLLESRVRVIKATLPFDDVWALIDDVHVGENGRLIVLDRYGNVVASHGEGELLEKLDSRAPIESWTENPQGVHEFSDGARFYYSAQVIAPQGMLPMDRMTLIWMRPEGSVVAVSREAENFLAVMGGLVLLFGLVLSPMLTRGVSRSFIKGAEAASRVSNGDFDARIEETGLVEMRQLATAFNRMAQRIQTRTQELSDANDELAQSAKMKDEFLAGMSHELRTPLNAVLGFSEALGDGIYGKLSEAQLLPLATIKSSGQHLLGLINDILDVAKVGAGKMELSFKRVGLEEVARDAVAYVEAQANQKNQTIEMNLPDGLQPVRGDKRRLKQIFVNLLSNAVKFTGEGGRLGLEAVIDEETERVRVTVWDHGIGIAQRDLDILFKPFHQVDSSLSRKAGGTGLGLTLVSEMIKLHGGDVAVESEVGKGSRFTVSLPVFACGTAPYEKDLAKSTVSKPRKKNPAAKGLKILVVEDEEANYKIASVFLKMHGYGVCWAQSGTEALEVALYEQPDLILMDIQMPEMDGLEATRVLRQSSEFSSTPIVALTALAMPGDREHAMSAGMDDYFTKPIAFERLLEFIDAKLSSQTQIFAN